MWRALYVQDPGKHVAGLPHRKGLWEEGVQGLTILVSVLQLLCFPSQCLVRKRLHAGLQCIDGVHL